MKFVLATLLISSCFGNFLPIPKSSDNGAFIQGLIQGLTKGGNDECTAEIADQTTDYQNFLAAWNKLTGGDIGAAKDMISDLNLILESIPEIAQKCDFAALAGQLAKLLNPESGYKLLQSRLKANGAMVSTCTAVIVACLAEEDHQNKCDKKEEGDAYGTLIRIITDWGL